MGSPVPGRRQPFLVRLRCSCLTVPHKAIVVGSSSHASGLLQSSRSRSRRWSACARHQLTSWVCVPLRDVSSRRPLTRQLACAPRHATGFPSPLRSVHDVSHVLDGFLRHVPCGFVSPHNHVRDFPSGGCPLGQPCRLIAHRCPRAVHEHPLPLRLTTIARREPRRRQECPPVFRALLRPRIRCQDTSI